MKYIKKKEERKANVCENDHIFLLPIEYTIYCQYFNPSQDSGTDSKVKFNITMAHKTHIFCFDISNSNKEKDKFSDFV